MDESKKIVREAAPQPDARAQDEATAFAQKTLNKHKRDESVRQHVHTASLCVFWLAFLTAVVIGVVFVFHLVTPSAWHFLSDPQKAELKTILIAGIGSSVVTNRAQRWLAKDDD